ncbi:hypothetical protein [Hwanghaeella sp.]|uniref:hypothetical protein n=1 Tax=Hwanghaeella sp. TaxID=2605943 RepID=UPI003CCBEB0E
MEQDAEERRVASSMHHPMMILLAVLFSAPSYASGDSAKPTMQYFSYFILVFGSVMLAYMAFKVARKWQAPVVPFVLSLLAPLLLPILFYCLAPYLLPSKAQGFVGIGTTLFFLVAVFLMRLVISRFRKGYDLREAPPTVERTKR